MKKIVLAIVVLSISLPALADQAEEWRARKKIASAAYVMIDEMDQFINVLQREDAAVNLVGRMRYLKRRVEALHKASISSRNVHVMHHAFIDLQRQYGLIRGELFEIGASLASETLDRWDQVVFRLVQISKIRAALN